jgi:pyrroloquinoline-quinone synthase
MNTFDLDLIVARHDLNEHPFYRAWREGTLPTAKLRAYASDYLPFIESIEDGWRRIGNAAHADEEREHAKLWGRFREALGADRGPACPEAVALAREASRAFADPVDALGVLYAFESQQPSTARSKLDGLQAHYAALHDAAEYFRVHADDYGERDELRGRIDALSVEDRGRAARACERACVAMYAALGGVLARG